MEPAAVTRAMSAAMSIASAAGLTVDEAVVLQQSNRFAVRLVPCDVLARVAPLVRRSRESAAFELAIAQALEGADSVVGALEPRMTPIVHERDGFAVTFWKYYEPLPSGALSPEQYAQALVGLHAEMRQADVSAPHFTDRVDEALTIVRDPSRSPELVDADRELLADVLVGLRRTVLDRGATEQLLHGEPHPGNVLPTTAGVRFVDLETCCYGPVEFDVAHAPIEVGRRYTAVDRLQLRDCRILVLAMVAAWRADRDDEYANGRTNRELLISEIRKAVDRFAIDLA